MNALRRSLGFTRGSALLLALLLILWQLGSQLGIIPHLFFPPPLEILERLLGMLASGDLISHTLTTLARGGAGLILGAVPGALVGLLMGWSPRLRQAMDPVLAAVHPMPKIAVLPLLMIVFGIGNATLIGAIAIGSFFPITISTMAGATSISPVYFEVAENLGASPRALFRRVLVPGSMPTVLTGLRLSVNAAMLITIGVELVAAQRGLGAMIWLAWELLRTTDLYVGLIIIALIGVLSNAALIWLRSRLVPWSTQD